MPITRWIADRDEHEICATEFKCPKCGEIFSSSDLTDDDFVLTHKFCPNCGECMFYEIDTKDVDQKKTIIECPNIDKVADFMRENTLSILGMHESKKVKVYIKKYDPDAAKVLTEDQKKEVIDRKVDEYYNSNGVRLLFTAQSFREKELTDAGVENVLTLLSAVLDLDNEAGEYFADAFGEHCRKLAENWFNIEYREVTVEVPFGC